MTKHIVNKIGGLVNRVRNHIDHLHHLHVAATTETKVIEVIMITSLLGLNLKFLSLMVHMMLMLT